MKKLLMLISILFAFTFNIAQVDVSTGGPITPYPNLNSAFAAVNAGTHTGAILINITASTTESVSAVLNASGTGGANYTSINIYPTAAGLSISGNIAGALVDFNGADNVTLDGRVNAVGSTKDLVIDNSNTSGWTIRFINDATSNVVKYCIVRGSNNTGNISSTQPSAGVILFSTTTAATPVGNDNNTLDYCDVDCRATAKAGVVSIGTSGATNSGIIVSNSNIFDFYVSSTSTTNTVGIVFGSQTTTCTAIGNSLYQTQPRAYATSANVNHYIIFVNNGNGGFNISNNYVGGSAPQCGGSAWTTTQTSSITTTGYRLWCIDFETSQTTSSEIQGNVVQNFNISSNFNSGGSSVFAAILVQSGHANIGNASGNIVGAATGTGSIIINNNTTTGTAAATLVVGISTTSNAANTYNIANNSIGSFKVISSNASYYYHFYPISIAGGTLIVNNNLIGSLTTPNSIENATGNAVTGTTQFNIHCIRYAPGGTGVISSGSITNNTIANINFSSTSAARPVFNGIFTANGPSSGVTTATVNGNTIRDVIYAGANTSTASTAGLTGIVLASTGAGQSAIQNQIYNLTSTHTSAVVYATGLFYSGGSGTTNTVAKNKIYNISLSTSATSHATPAIAGILVNAGTTTYSNNMVSIGLKPDGSSITTGYPMAAVYESLGTDNFYFNSLHMCGTGVVSVGNTYAFQSQQTTNTRNFRNNIFVNSRSNASGTGKNYAVRVGGSAPNPTGLTINYNNYFASGTGSVFGFFNNLDVANLGAWQTAVGQDANSKSVAVNFVSDTDLHLTGASIGDANLKGVSISGYTDDIDGDIRQTPPSSPYLGADEIPPVHNITRNTHHVTIQQAINAATTLNGDIIAADAGTYPEEVTVNKSVTLRGPNTGVAGFGTRLPEAIIDGGGVRAGFLIAADDVTIDGFKIIQCHDPAGIKAAAISSWGASSSNVKILNNIIQNNSVGIVEPYGWEIKNNLIENNNYATGVPVAGAGIYSDFLTNGMVIENNRFNNHLNNNPVIFGATVGNNHTNLLFKNNELNEAWGVYCVGVDNSQFIGNTFNMSEPGGTTCITFAGACDNNSLQNNFFTGSHRGLRVVDHGYGLGDNTNISANKNSFSTSLSEFAVGNLSGYTGVLDASGNWYGSNDPTVFSLKLSGSVDYTPWLNAGTDLSTDPGFQPDLSTLWVNTSSPQSGTVGRIQEAVNLVSGSTINLLAGNYVEPAQVVINKNVTIIGASKSTTFIKPGFNTGSSGDARGFILVQSGFAFNLSKVTVDGTGWQVMQGIRSFGTGTIDDINLTQIQYPGYNGLAVVCFNNMTISNCSFTQIGRVGIIFFGTGVTNGQAIGNIYTGKGTGDWLDYGVEFGGGAVGTIDNCSFTQCKGVASSDGSTSAGVLVSTYYGAGTNATIKNSTITNNTEGIAVGFDASDASSVIAYSNNISDNTAFGVSSTNPLVNAKNNWWGHASGPFDNKTLPGIPNYNNPSGLGNAVTSNVDYQPWNIFSAYYNDPLNPYKLYLSGSPTLIDSIVYPNDSWAKPWEPGADPANNYPGDNGIDWGFQSGLDFYIVPQVGANFGSSSITVEFDDTYFTIDSICNGNIYSGGYFNYLVTSSGSMKRVTIDGGLFNTNLTVSSGKYIAKLALKLLKVGYAPISFVSKDFRYYNGIGGQLGVYTTSKNASVKNYLGDVVSSSPASEATGDGKVDVHDLNAFTISYWSGIPNYTPGLLYYKAKYDIGPTSNSSVFGMPLTDYKIQFEDLVIFSMSYGRSGNSLYPKIAPPPTEPVEISIGKPLASGNETLVPVFISGAVQDLRAASLSFSGSFGKLISADKSDLLNAYTTPVMVMSRTDGNNVFVDLSIVGADVHGLSEEGQLFVLRFEGKANVKVTSAEVRNLANSPMLVKLINNYKGIPTEFGITQNYPNPFNPSTTISYQIPVAAMVEISVFNSIGEKVGMLVNEVKEPGYYETTWNASSMPSGVYFFRINAGEFTAVKKMMLMK